jgi:hypothetical protein
MLAAMQSCAPNQTMKTITFVPASVVPDTLAPKYLHNVSQIKYWDRIAAANRATNFGWWDSTGRVVEMNEFYNKVVVLTFFGTWSMPSLDQLYRIRLARLDTPDTNVLYIGVAMREPATDGAAVMHVDSFARARHVDYQILVGSRDFGFTYGGIDAVPMTFVIARSRKIIATFDGVVSEGKLVDTVASAENNP